MTDAAQEHQVTEATACATYHWLQQVCTTRLLQTSITLGGLGVVVQIDESLMKHKQKVKNVQSVPCMAYRNYFTIMSLWYGNLNTAIHINCSCLFEAIALLLIFAIQQFLLTKDMEVNGVNQS